MLLLFLPQRRLSNASRRKYTRILLQDLLLSSSSLYFFTTILFRCCDLQHKPVCLVRGSALHHPCVAWLSIELPGWPLPRGVGPPMHSLPAASYSVGLAHSDADQWRKKGQSLCHLSHPRRRSITVQAGTQELWGQRCVIIQTATMPIPVLAHWHMWKKVCACFWDSFLRNALG